MLAANRDFRSGSITSYACISHFRSCRQSRHFASAQYLSQRANSGSRQAMKDHYVSSPSSAFASFRSCVSNPSVNQP